MWYEDPRGHRFEVKDTDYFFCFFCDKLYTIYESRKLEEL